METEQTWKGNLRASAVCLAALPIAWVAGKISYPASMVVFAIGYAWGLIGPVRETLPSLREGKVDIDFLMLLVAIGAWMLGHPSEGLLLLVLFNGSRAMESYARHRTHRSVEDLLRDVPDSALRIVEGREEEVPVGELQPGDELVVRPGDRVAEDAVVVEGCSFVETAAITGESKPRRVNPGVEVVSGAVNGIGRLVVRVVRPASESAYQKIIALVENAPARRSPAQVLSETIGTTWTVAVLVLCTAAFLLWWLVGGVRAGEAGYRAMVLLVAASPCAIVLSIPSAVLAAIARAARQGILFNGGLGLSLLPTVKAVALDKTGTLTEGAPTVVRVDRCGGGEGLMEEMALAAALARCSTHPAARAVLEYVERHHPEAAGQALELSGVNERAGQGISACWGSVAAHLGKPRGCDALALPMEDAGRVFLYVNGRFTLGFALQETPREGAAEAVQGLHEQGLRTLILSGDVAGAVARLAERVGIREAHGGLRPEDKHGIIQRLAKSEGVMMVGDGVNDAPALSAATVGVAMGLRGSAATLAQADVVLTRDELRDLPKAVELARRTQRIIRQNLAIAVGAALLLVLLAALEKLPLVLGVFGHEGGTVLVVLNSLRLLLGERGAVRLRGAGGSVKDKGGALAAGGWSAEQV